MPMGCKMTGAQPLGVWCDGGPLPAQRAESARETVGTREVNPSRSSPKEDRGSMQGIGQGWMDAPEAAPAISAVVPSSISTSKPRSLAAL